MMLTVNDLGKAHGATQVLTEISFVVNDRDFIGIVGANGVGKSTLLKILAGLEEADSGKISYRFSLELGYLPQTTSEFYGQTIDDLILESVGGLRQLEDRMRQLETAMPDAEGDQLTTILDEYGEVSTQFQERGGYELDYRIDAVMEGLHLAHLPRTQDVNILSGGEKSRIQLASLLLRSPDLLLLDEPTNHLDFASFRWLEIYLRQHKGAMLVASHDRAFLNPLVTQILEINEYTHRLNKYEGNYEEYVLSKESERKRWEERYREQQEEIKELRQYMRETGRQVGHHRASRDSDKRAHNFRGGRVERAISSNVRSAEEQLKRIDENPVPKPPQTLGIYSHFHSEPLKSNVLISVTRLCKAYADRQILSDVSFTVASGARITLVGPNGAGKTTLIKIIKGLEIPDDGDVRIASSVRMGYLPQLPRLADPEMTVLEAYRQGLVGYEEDILAELLRYGLFRYEDLVKTVNQLSIGQQRKLEIARLIAEAPNVLLLDEPTNFISLDVLEALETAIDDFPGPVIAVSHDRWFIQRFGGEVWQLRCGNLVMYPASHAKDI